MPAVPLPVYAPGRGERRDGLHPRVAAGAGADDADLPRGGQVPRRPRGAPDAEGAEADRLPLRGGRRPRDTDGEPERIAREHRRHREPGGHRAGAYAAPRACGGGGDGQHGRTPAVPVPPREPRRGWQLPQAVAGVDGGTTEGHARPREDSGLTAEEYDRITSRLGREPTYAELGLFAALWSEHCAYKHSRAYLSRLPTEGPRVLQGPGENAGAIDIGDGWAVVFKIESHNHPSFI